MSKLSELLKDIDKIEDDGEFMQAEHEFVREYCWNNKFELSDEDMRTVLSRGFSDWFEDWKNEYEEGLREKQCDVKEW